MGCVLMEDVDFNIQYCTTEVVLLGTLLKMPTWMRKRMLAMHWARLQPTLGKQRRLCWRVGIYVIVSVELCSLLS